MQDFQEEQNLVARLVHQLRDPDTDVRYSTLVAARERFAKGGPRRQRHTLPPVAFAALQLVGDIAARKGAGESVEVDCNTVGGVFCHCWGCSRGEVGRCSVMLQLVGALLLCRSGQGISLFVVCKVAPPGF